MIKCSRDSWCFNLFFHFPYHVHYYNCFCILLGLKRLGIYTEFNLVSPAFGQIVTVETVLNSVEKCWTVHCRQNLPACSLIALVILCPGRRSWKIPILQCASFFSLPRMIATSPSFKLVSLELYWKLWSSHKSVRYSFAQCDQTWPL